MICPKCQNLLRTVDKNGVHIDQCDGCRGIFLDRGELEQIAAAESAYYGAGQPPPYRPDVAGGPAPTQQYGHPTPPPHGGYRDSPRPFFGGRPDSPRPYRGGYPDSPHHYGHRRRKRSFLEDLFD